MLVELSVNVIDGFEISKLCEGLVLIKHRHVFVGDSSASLLLHAAVEISHGLVDVVFCEWASNGSCCNVCLSQMLVFD